MYAGQFANLSGPVGEGSGVGGALGARLTGGAVGMLIDAGGADSVDVAPPEQAARNAEKPTRTLPWRKRRRLRSAISHASPSGCSLGRPVMTRPPVRHWWPTAR